MVSPNQNFPHTNKTGFLKDGVEFWPETGFYNVKPSNISNQAVYKFFYKVSIKGGRSFTS